MRQPDFYISQEKDGFFFIVLELELRALSHCTSSFFDRFFELGSLELFAQTGFEPRSS
jgi:hypothetical protein